MSAREKRRLLTRPRGAFCRLDIDREFVDLRRVGDHQSAKIVAVSGEGFLGLGAGGHAPEIGWLADQPQPVRADDGKGAHSVTELGSDMPSQDTTERESGEMELLVSREHGIEPIDQDARQPFGGMRFGWRCQLAEPGQVRGDDGKHARQRQHVADPMRPRAIAAVEQDQRRSGAPDAPHHPTTPAGGLDTFRLGRNAGDKSSGLCADLSHRSPLKVVSTRLIAGFAWRA